MTLPLTNLKYIGCRTDTCTTQNKFCKALGTHETLDETRLQIAKLIKSNEDFRDRVDSQIVESNDLWNNASGGTYPLEQFLLWVCIALNLILTLATIAWIMKFSCRHIYSKEAKNRAQKSNENWIELQARIMDLETDAQITGTARRPQIEDAREQEELDI